MQFIDLIPKHKIGDIIVFREQKDQKELLVQGIIKTAVANVVDDKYQWVYEVEYDDLVHYLEDTHVILNITTNTLMGSS